MDVLPASEAAARERLIARLHADLVGPSDSNEKLEALPSDVYLTGILWPRNTQLQPEDDDRLALSGEADEPGSSDADDSAQVAAPAMRRPSTAGLSFAIRPLSTNSARIDVTVTFGAYEPGVADDGRPVWVRRPVKFHLADIPLDRVTQDIELPDTTISGLRVHIRTARAGAEVLATVTLVNGGAPEEPGREALEKQTLFQTRVEVRAGEGCELAARPSRRAKVDDDDYSMALLYRNALEYAVGHTCSADWTAPREGRKHEMTVDTVSTTWLPSALVPAVSADGHPVFAKAARHGLDPFSARWLVEADEARLIEALTGVTKAYGDWILLQEQAASKLDGEAARTAARHLTVCRTVLERMENGIRHIADHPEIQQAFRLANLAMAVQYRWDPKRSGELRWRPFQLGFLLLTLASAVDSAHPDRGVMDLLWFPTGGGKTEAYLALIAFVAFHRRLSRPDPDEGSGVAVIMRYTLRLLTTQQFTRAAAMIAACEAIRRGRISGPGASKLGNAPFSIGLWVGRDATPNSRKEAYEAQRNPLAPSPRQLTTCPCCGTSLKFDQPAASDPVHVLCENAECLLTGSEPLPVWTVDEDVFEQRPTLLIGTVDKFAQITRSPRTAQLFAVGSGAQPQLILQDELHLISGPLGTIAGLYETALDLILSADGSRPKIVGSTATIRRAPDQVVGLFDRDTCQFPPPGLNEGDSGFAVIDDKAPGRRYVGVTTAGRSAKFTLQAVAASLLQGAAGGLKEAEQDHYWTLVAYFNSLRELGGALVLMQDDVNDAIQLLATRRGERPRRPGNVQELTSRRSQQQVREMLDHLEVKADQAHALDVVLASNMLSVGVDISRLGLMLVNGQPKTMAEYIQATSRVGRGTVRGLVIPILNSAKPRDRSHYETFRTWHATLYRDVEATSVTPFASRARDRALHAVLAAVIRHLIPGLLERPVLDQSVRDEALALIDRIAARARRVDELETDVRDELVERLDRWMRRKPSVWWLNPFRKEPALLQDAERAAALHAAGRNVGDAWPTPNTMRGVEPASAFRLAERLKKQVN